MRLWSLHPQYLDRQGLTALWREALLAQAVLRGQTRGYQHHPQLRRFQQHPAPLAAISAYLAAVHAEATRRGYHFDATKLGVPAEPTASIPVTTGQLAYEWQHLLAKLARRSPAVHEQWADTPQPPAVQPLFRVEPGPVAAWEKLPG